MKNTTILCAALMGGTMVGAIEPYPGDDMADAMFRNKTPFSEAMWSNYLNYDESKVRAYTLPAITSRTRENWEQNERPAILKAFQDCMYGLMPPAPDELRVELVAERGDALGNLAIRREYLVTCSMRDGQSMNFELLLYAPKNAPAPPPVFVGLNFSGNQANTPETDVRMTRARLLSYAPEHFGRMMPPPENLRGQKTESWNYVEAVKRGYAVATVCCNEFCPDHPNGFRQSAFTLFYPDRDLRPAWEIPFPEFKKAGFRRPVSAIGGWAWGLSRMLDALEKIPLVDARRAAVIGHSRLGKAALWAGACDQRFKLVISNNSGFGGAALSRRNFGTDLELHMIDSPHFFAGRLADFAFNEPALPIDQHQLLALIAPRALYVASSNEDLAADPRGEFLSTAAAAPVWRLYRQTDWENIPMPEPGGFIESGMVRYHLKQGNHSITAWDWQNYYDFADRVLRHAGPEQNIHP